MGTNEQLEHTYRGIQQISHFQGDVQGARSVFADSDGLATRCAVVVLSFFSTLLLLGVARTAVIGLESCLFIETIGNSSGSN